MESFNSETANGSFCDDDDDDDDEDDEEEEEEVVVADFSGGNTMLMNPINDFGTVSS